MSNTLVVVTRNPLVQRNLERIAAQMGLAYERGESFERVAARPDAPLAVVVELEAAGALEAVGRMAEQWPRTLLAGFVSLPDPDLWLAGERAGCHLVATRGALPAQLRKKLQRWKEQPGGRLLRLFSLADVAGRLGLVQRLEDTPVGPLAIYHIGGVVYAAQDTCPHAGAQLSRGELSLDHAVITCPQHGSRFDVRTGERLRGPADLGIRTFRVVIENAEVFLQLE